MANHAEANAGGGHSSHVVTPRTYFINFAALMVLLVLTLAAASLNLGDWNIVIAMTIAVAKALLVALFFMHVRYSSKLVQFISIIGVFWLMILFLLTFNDYFSRAWLHFP
jgi:cytochrome c oxidase subunit 4